MRRRRAVRDGWTTRSNVTAAPRLREGCLGKISSAQCGRHVRVAKVIVNNNPETMKLRGRRFRTAASWCFAPALMLRSIASAGASTAQMRCDASRSMKGEPNRSSSSFETRVRAFEFAGPLQPALLWMRTAEPAARRRTVFGNFQLTMSNSPSRSHGAFLRPGVATLLRSPESRVGGAPIRHPCILTSPQGAPGYFKGLAFFSCAPLTPPLPSSGYSVWNRDRA